ncbi:MAG: CapA family protein [Chloroflexi bacterium]|nr:CapA family protein [Chloroflexota bacterium]
MRYLALLALAAAACAPGPEDGCSGDLDAATTAPAERSDSPPFRILWLGDTLLADAAEPHLAANGYAWAFDRMRPLPHADYVIANAEGPITTETAVDDPSQRWSYAARPEAASALAAEDVSTTGLANNHAVDRGPTGLADTVKHLEAAGVATLGAGADLDAALRPLIVETPHGRVGVVAFAQGGGVRKNAGEHRPGIAVLTRCNAAEGAQRAREAGARWLVAFVHWGANYADVLHSQRAQAAILAAAGFDLAIGHGPHVVQPVEVVEGMPVVYSLGNWVFGTPGRFSDDAPGVGLMATTAFGPDGLEALRLHCIRTDNDEVAFQPRPCTRTQADAVLRTVHPDIAIEDGVGVLRWPVE